MIDLNTWPRVSRYDRPQIDLHELPDVRDWCIRIVERPDYQVSDYANNVPRPREEKLCHT